VSIDRGVFVEWMEELDAHFPGDRSERVVAVYWAQLSEQMSTQDFEQACVEMLGSREYFPPWREFVTAVEGDDYSAAMEAWERVLEMASDWRRACPSEQLNEAGQRALRQVGGIRKLAMMNREDIDFRRKDFLAAYRISPTDEPDSLPPMTEQGREQLRAAGPEVKLVRERADGDDG